jgi:4-aminobenzoate N-oxygenase
MTTPKETAEIKGEIKPEIKIDQTLIRRIGTGWPKRATLRGDLYSFEGTAYDDATRPDYPLELVPFRAHPRFLAAPPEQQQAVLTWAWLAYNERTIAMEEHLANPAFTLIMHDAFAGADDIELRKSIQQCLIDEHFHTYMHMAAVHDTRRFRGLKETLAAPAPIPLRRLRECQQRASGPAERAFVGLAFGVVAEVSVKDFLNLMAQNEVIQPAHRRVAYLHNRDEHAHGQLLGEVCKVLWCKMSAAERRLFVQALPPALEAFVAQDYSTWRAILDHVGVLHAQEIIADTEADAAHRSLVRDVSSLKRLALEMGILDQLRDTYQMECLS